MSTTLDLTAYKIGAPPIFPALPEGFARAVPVPDAVTPLAPFFPAQEVLMGLLGDARIQSDPAQPIFASGAVASPRGINLCMIAIMALKAATIEIQFSTLPRSYSFLLSLIGTVISRLRTHIQFDIDFDVLALHSLGLASFFDRYSTNAYRSGASNDLVANVYTNIYDKFSGRTLIHSCHISDYYHIQSLCANVRTTANCAYLLNFDGTVTPKYSWPLEMSKIHKRYMQRSCARSDSVEGLRNHTPAILNVAAEEITSPSLAVNGQNAPDETARVLPVHTPITPRDHKSHQNKPADTSMNKEAIYRANFWRFADRMPVPSRDRTLNISRKLSNIVTIN